MNIDLRRETSELQNSELFLRDHDPHTKAQKGTHPGMQLIPGYSVFKKNNYQTFITLNYIETNFKTQ